MKSPCPKCGRLHKASFRCSARAGNVATVPRGPVLPAWVAETLTAAGVDPGRWTQEFAALTPLERGNRIAVLEAMLVIARATPANPALAPTVAPHPVPPDAIPDDWEPVTPKR